MSNGKPVRVHLRVAPRGVPGPVTACGRSIKTAPEITQEIDETTCQLCIKRAAQIMEAE